jgi:hypothetical protein
MGNSQAQNAGSIPVARTVARTVARSRLDVVATTGKVAASINDKMDEPAARGHGDHKLRTWV